jgi:two-component sensor histidine kinase
LGLQLINDLSRQIGGKVKYEHKNGAWFIINFINRDLRKKED